MNPPDPAYGAWTSPDAASRAVVVLLPLGSFEQHGPHLPLDTDTRIAVAVARRAASRGGASARPADAASLVVAPALAFGASGEHAGFAGTLSLGTDVLASVLVELARSAGPEVRALVVVNGHGGNGDALAAALRTSGGEGRTVLSWSPRRPAGGDLHAGRTETSVMLAIDPQLVRLDRAEAGEVRDDPATLAALRRHGLRPITANGVLGDPSGASAVEGDALLSRWADELVGLITPLREQG